MEWLNRAGIILNFLAGFMIAPELIGLERLQNIENNIEHNISELISRAEIQLRNYGDTQKQKDFILSNTPFLRQIMNKPDMTVDEAEKSNQYYHKQNSILTFFLILVILLGRAFIDLFDLSFSINCIIYLVIIFTLCVWVVSLFKLYEILDADIDKTNKSKENALFFLLAFLSLTTPGFVFITTLTIIPISIQKIFIMLLDIQKKIYNFIFQKLLGKQRLRSLLVFWGIIFLILGNLFQFLATF